MWLNSRSSDEHCDKGGRAVRMIPLYWTVLYVTSFRIAVSRENGFFASLTLSLSPGQSEEKGDLIKIFHTEKGGDRIYKERKGYGGHLGLD